MGISIREIVGDIETIRCNFELNIPVLLKVYPIRRFQRASTPGNSVRLLHMRRRELSFSSDLFVDMK